MPPSFVQSVKICFGEKVSFFLWIPTNVIVVVGVFSGIDIVRMVFRGAKNTLLKVLVSAFYWEIKLITVQ